MAEAPTSKPTDSNKRTRRVKNPETFRQRAIKATEQAERPQRKHRVRAGAGKVVRPVATTSSKLFRRQPFRLIGKVLRLVGRVVLPSYFRKSWKELRQVTWPTWQQSRQLTFAVLAFAVVFGAVIAGVDYGLDKLFRAILIK